MKKIQNTPIKKLKNTKMNALRPSAKTLAMASGADVRPNPTVSPTATINAGALCGSIQNTGEMDVYVRFPSVRPDTDTTDDILTVKAGTIYNFEHVGGRFYPTFVIDFVPKNAVEGETMYSTASAEYIFFY